MPEIRLNSVLFPEPLGPMILWISPSSRLRSTFDKATRPSNRLENPVISSSILLSLADLHEPARDQVAVDQPADARRNEHHCENDHQAEDQQLVLVIVAGQIGDDGYN